MTTSLVFTIAIWNGKEFDERRNAVLYFGIMADADIIIIGAGMAGLTCGCLLAQKGLKVLMVEKNPKVGGCCTSFQKEGFSFDLSVQSIGECLKGGRIWRLLDKLNLVDQIHFIPLEPAREYYFPNQKVVQSSRMETHLENLSVLFHAQFREIGVLA